MLEKCQRKFRLCKRRVMNMAHNDFVYGDTAFRNKLLSFKICKYFPTKSHFFVLHGCIFFICFKNYGLEVLGDANHFILYIITSCPCFFPKLVCAFCQFPL